MTEGRHAARHVTHLHLPLSVLLFERAAIFTAAAENVRDFRNETGKHCLQTDDIDYSEHKLELQFDKQHSARRRSLGRQQKRTNPQHLSAQFPPCIFTPPLHFSPPPPTRVLLAPENLCSTVYGPPILRFCFLRHNPQQQQQRWRPYWLGPPCWFIVVTFCRAPSCRILRICCECLRCP